MKKFVAIVGGAAAVVAAIHIAGAYLAKKEEDAQAETVNAHL